MRCIATCHEATEALASEELRALGCETTVLAPGILLVSGVSPFEELSALAQSGAVIFLRHLAPVQIELQGDVASIPALTEQLGTLLKGSAAPIALQLRSTSDYNNEQRKVLALGVTSALGAQGFVFDRKSPLTVASVFVSAQQTLIGVCPQQQTLSTWTGGEVRYRHDEKQMVSRAELKLVEAMEVLNFRPSLNLPVLDLGAAPGGWTRVLAHHRYSVVAVDPAELDPSVLRLKGVTHHRFTAERFLHARRSEQFGAIVNDMRMSPVASAEIMDQCAPLLVKDGIALMTAKLEKRSAQATLAELREMFAVLDHGYERIAARQLFHNRSECSIVLKRRLIG